MTTLPPSCAHCLKIWENQPPGTLRTLRACNGIALPIHVLLVLPLCILITSIFSFCSSRNGRQCFNHHPSPPQKVQGDVKLNCKMNNAPCPWPRGLRRRSTAARLLRSCVRIPLGHVCPLCCQVEVSATSWSLVQRIPTDCDASLCVIKKPLARGGHSPFWTSEPEKIINNNNDQHNAQSFNLFIYLLLP
jgi:hypothetical protein